MTQTVGRPVLALVRGIGDYHVQVIGGLAGGLAEHGVPLLVVAVDTFTSRTTASVVLDLVRDGTVQGMVALADGAIHHRRDLPRLVTEVGLPVVTLSSRFGDAPRVSGDNDAGMRELMAHLLDECGARRPVLLRGTPDHPDSLTRERIFREECLRRGVAVDEELVVDGLFRSKPAFDALSDLIRRGTAFDAVVALNDPSAFGALSALDDHGLRVPDDVLLTGFDDITDAAGSWPPLTTVDQRLAEQGRLAGQMLLDVIAGGRPDDVEVPARLVRRASTTRRELTADQVKQPARALQARVTLQELAVQISWDMANCRTMDDVLAALDPCLSQLGVRRCFLALDVMDASPAATGPGGEERSAGQELARLAFCYRDGRAEPPDPRPFPRREVLPPSLREELGRGVLLLQPLSVDGRERGHLVYDFDTTCHVLVEALRIELPRTVETVFSSQELRDHAHRLEALVARRTAELERANAELRRSVLRDGLTGIANRRALEAFLTDAFETTAEPPRLALLMVDVDHFKAFNDTYGHVAGDDALRTVASCLEGSVRSPGDLACRYGGEEFAVILADCGPEDALAVARRFGRLLARAAIPHESSPVADLLTASIGISATAPGTDDGPPAPAGGPLTAEALVSAADRALYRAKNEGRNRIVVDERSDAPGTGARA